MSDDKGEYRDFLGSFIGEVQLNGDSLEDIDIYGGESLGSKERHKNRSNEHSLDFTESNIKLKELSVSDREKKQWIGR
jgi:hypothetical protein